MWINPYWGSLRGPDAEQLRAIFQSIQDWTRNPTFGNVSNPTIAGGGVQVQPKALRIFNEHIESDGYAAGTQGWRISATGDAEFNNIAIRGTFRTASSGRRIEIGTTAQNRIDFYSGSGGETTPGNILSEFTGTYETLKLYGPQFGSGQSSIELTQNNTIHLRARGTSIAATTTGVNALSIQVVAPGETGLSAAGVTRLNGRVEMNNDHAYLSNYSFFIKTGRLWQGTDGAELGVGEGIVAMGGTAGIRIGQRGRARNDIAGSFAWYGFGDQLRLYGEGHGDMLSHQSVGGWHDWRVHNLPPIIGGYLCIAGSGQIGPDGSSIQWKEDVQDLDRNPLMQMRPVKFRWKEDTVQGAARVNERTPELVAGLIVEEVAQVAPDAVIYDDDGQPQSLNYNVLMGYIVKAIKELSKGKK